MPFINAAMQLSPKAIIFSPTDSTALVPIAQQMTKQGIFPITVDAPLSKPVDVANFQSNHFAGGVAAAKAMIQLTGGKGNLPRRRPQTGPARHRCENARLCHHDEGTRRKRAAGHLSGHRLIEGSRGGVGHNPRPPLPHRRVRDPLRCSAGRVSGNQAGEQARQDQADRLRRRPASRSSISSGASTTRSSSRSPTKWASSRSNSPARLARGQIKPSQVKEEHLLPFYVVTRKNVNSPAVKPYFYKSSCS